MLSKKLLILLVCLAQFACGSSEPQPKSNEKTFVEKQLSTQLDALEKSKDVEAQLNDAVKKRDQKMREQGI